MATVHQMPALPYAQDALAPHISKETIEYHYGKHFKAYVDKLNELIPGTPFENATLEDIIKKADGAIFNQGAQAWNHAFYFEAFSPTPQKAPKGELAHVIDREFGSFDKFKEAFEKAAVGQFASGWAWLVKDKAGNVKIVTTSNAGNPLRDGLTPIMVMDVWEHAYYIDHRNRRADSIKATWEVLDWKVIEKRFAK